MKRETSANFLDVLKTYSPDEKQPVAVIRKDLSSFYKEFIEGTLPAVHPVEIENGVTGYLCTTEMSDPSRTILFFHGGGFCAGSTDDHLGLIAGLSRAARAEVFSIDYRLAPEHVFPAAVGDAVAAYRFLQLHGVPSHQILPVGLSAGGNLVLEMLLSARSQGLLMPRAALCMSPMTDLTFGGDSVTRNRETDWIRPPRLDAIRTLYLAGHDPSDPEVSPLNANLSGLPRLVIQAGNNELLFDGIRAFVKKAKWAGVPVRFEVWEGMYHDWQLFGTQVPEAQQAIDRVGILANEVFIPAG